jgi:hypothetical protein
MHKRYYSHHFFLININLDCCHWRSKRVHSGGIKPFIRQSPGAQDDILSPRPSTSRRMRPASWPVRPPLFLELLPGRTSGKSNEPHGESSSSSQGTDNPGLIRPMNCILSRYVARERTTPLWGGGNESSGSGRSSSSTYGFTCADDLHSPYFDEAVQRAENL